MFFQCNMSMQVIVHRTESDWTAYGIQSGGERNLIGWRTESDWVANGIRLGGERDLVAKRKKPQHQTRYCGFHKFMNKATL